MASQVLPDSLPYGKPLPLSIIESSHVEFKRFSMDGIDAILSGLLDRRPTELVSLLLEYVMAFANVEGGILLLGIDDSTRNVFGLRMIDENFADNRGKLMNRVGLAVDSLKSGFSAYPLHLTCANLVSVSFIPVTGHPADILNVQPSYFVVVIKIGAARPRLWTSLPPKLVGPTELNALSFVRSGDSSYTVRGVDVMGLISQSAAMAGGVPSVSIPAIPAATAGPSSTAEPPSGPPIVMPTPPPPPPELQQQPPASLSIQTPAIGPAFATSSSSSSSAAAAAAAARMQLTTTAPSSVVEAMLWLRTGHELLTAVEPLTALAHEAVKKMESGVSTTDLSPASTLPLDEFKLAASKACEQLDSAAAALSDWAIVKEVAGHLTRALTPATRLDPSSRCSAGLAIVLEGLQAVIHLRKQLLGKAATMLQQETFVRELLGMSAADVAQLFRRARDSPSGDAAAVNALCTQLQHATQWFVEIKSVTAQFEEAERALQMYVSRRSQPHQAQADGIKYFVDMTCEPDHWRSAWQTIHANLDVQSMLSELDSSSAANAFKLKDLRRWAAGEDMTPVPSPVPAAPVAAAAAAAVAGPSTGRPKPPAYVASPATATAPAAPPPFQVPTERKEEHQPGRLIVFYEPMNFAIQTDVGQMIARLMVRFPKKKLAYLCYGMTTAPVATSRLEQLAKELRSAAVSVQALDSLRGAAASPWLKALSTIALTSKPTDVFVIVSVYGKHLTYFANVPGPRPMVAIIAAIETQLHIKGLPPVLFRRTIGDFMADSTLAVSGQVAPPVPVAAPSASSLVQQPPPPFPVGHHHHQQQHQLFPVHLTIRDASTPLNVDELAAEHGDCCEAIPSSSGVSSYGFRSRAAAERIAYTIRSRDPQAKVDVSHRSQSVVEQRAPAQHPVLAQPPSALLPDRRHVSQTIRDRAPIVSPAPPRLSDLMAGSSSWRLILGPFPPLTDAAPLITRGVTVAQNLAQVQGAKVRYVPPSGDCKDHSIVFDNRLVAEVVKAALLAASLPIRGPEQCSSGLPEQKHTAPPLPPPALTIPLSLGARSDALLPTPPSPSKKPQPHPVVQLKRMQVMLEDPSVAMALQEYDTSKIVNRIQSLHGKGSLESLSVHLDDDKKIGYLILEVAESAQLQVSEALWDALHELLQVARVEISLRSPNPAVQIALIDVFTEKFRNAICGLPEYETYRSVTKLHFVVESVGDLIKISLCWPCSWKQRVGDKLREVASRAAYNIVRCSPLAMLHNCYIERVQHPNGVQEAFAHYLFVEDAPVTVPVVPRQM